MFRGRAATTLVISLALMGVLTACQGDDASDQPAPAATSAAPTSGGGAAGASPPGSPPATVLYVRCLAGLGYDVVLDANGDAQLAGEGSGDVTHGPIEGTDPGGASAGSGSSSSSSAPTPADPTAFDAAKARCAEQVPDYRAPGATG
jgi:hypothetical protein